MNRGRFQAQGDGLEKSEPWATYDHINKNKGINKIDILKNKLSKKEFKKRSLAFNKATKFVNNSPNNGHPAFVSKTYSNSLINRSIRVDIEIRDGNAFIN